MREVANFFPVKNPGVFGPCGYKVYSSEPLRRTTAVYASCPLYGSPLWKACASAMTAAPFPPPHGSQIGQLVAFALVFLLDLLRANPSGSIHSVGLGANS